MEYQPEERDLVTINLRALCGNSMGELQEILEHNVEHMNDEVNAEALVRVTSFKE